MTIFRPNIREVILVLSMAACVAIATGILPNMTTVYHPTTMGCELGCDVPGAGYPFAYIADKPYLSPDNSADWIGVILGVDQLFPYWLALDFVIFTIALFVSFAGFWYLVERLDRGSGRAWLTMISRIFNALLIVIFTNLVFLAIGVVTGLLLMPYYWILLSLSAVFIAWRILVSNRQRLADMRTAAPPTSRRPGFARRIGMSALFTVATLILFVTFWLGGGLFQEPATTAVDTARLELSGWDWIREKNSDRTIVRTEKFDWYLKTIQFDGWKHVDTLGSGYVFKRDGETVILSCRQYSRRYRICSSGPGG